VPFPIELNTNRLNTIQAIWARSKNEIKDEEYNEFYRSSATITTSRCSPAFSADAPLAIQAALRAAAEHRDAWAWDALIPR
jgi:TNF receptor-associated protein 1